MQATPLPECGYYLNGNNITEYYVNHTLKAVRQILKDATVTANHNKEVEEFKFNLTSIVNKYEEIKNASLMAAHKKTDRRNSLLTYEEDALLELVKQYLYITHHYFELAEEKMSPDSKFIANILMKHEGYYVLLIYKHLVEAIA